MSNLSKVRQKKPPKKEKHDKRFSKKFFIILSVCLLVAVAVVLVIWIGGNNQADQSKYSIGYVVETNPGGESMNVDVTLDIAKLNEKRTIELYKGLLTAQWLECVDDAGNEIPYSDTTDLISIGPIDENIKKLHFKYDVYLGKTGEEWEDTSYIQGCLFEDLVTFSGEYALLTPYVDPDVLDSMGNYVTRASFEFHYPEDWQSILPYQKPLDEQRSFTKNKPDWDFFNSISKSAFCFGQFEQNQNFQDTMVFVDKGITDGISEYPMEALTTFLEYYTTIFGEPLDDVPIVLLRNRPSDDCVIVGGIGSGSSALSINLRMADDFKVLSNMVYHSFFDSKVKSRNLRYATNNWLYDGLSEYYVGISAGILSDTIKDEYGIDSPASMPERYLEYLYFSLKEPGLLAVSPSDEMSMYSAQQEFYMGVKAPLLVDAINYSIEQQDEIPDGLIKALVEKGSNSKPLDVEKFLQEICGPDYEAITNYVSGRALIPNYRDYNIDALPAEQILNILDADEEFYSYLFIEEGAYYPYEALYLLNEEPFMAEVAKRGIHYNTTEIQNEVKGFSSVLDRLLLQYAMWASLADIDDITQPNIIRKLTEEDVTKQWDELRQEIGYEIDLS